MSREIWLEKAETLRKELWQLKAAELDEPIEPTVDELEARERLLIARWLRSEFSDEPPADTATLALFPTTPQ